MCVINRAHARRVCLTLFIKVSGDYVFSTVFSRIIHVSAAE